MSDENPTPGKAAQPEPEPDYTANLDGNITLDQTTSLCEVEQDAGFQLQKLKFSTVTEGSTVLLVNKADFMSKPIGRLKHLLFFPAPSTDPVQREKQKKQKVEVEKWTFICESDIYVQDNVTHVMVFGKKKL